ncbi:MFS transporter [Brumicola nitratireducens]|uniref:Major facilitator superfamily MFS_1 n=1 Tax=Glaciecola nitratireducens (strain JCM 12485 / KCTC 12276 / FR1064) TaxID=1085623 RepID=G4QKS0_GLANF|nr:major facilitator superfamily MFS_1 [Glaciecola nitratireducens FR1064]
MLLSALFTTKSKAAISSPTNLGLISLTYFFYFGQLGVITPYAGVFLDGRGFSSQEIGSLLAIITLTRVLGPNLWAAIADKTGRGADIVRFGCLLAFVTFTAVYFSYSFWALTFSFGMMMMFWTAVLPQLEVITVSASKDSKGGYGAVRLWGSIGFIVLSLLIGFLLDFFSTEVIIYTSSFCLLALYISSLFIASPLAVPKHERVVVNEWHKVRSLVFIVFIISAIFLQISFGSYYSFFALYMADLDYSGKQTGLFIAVGVLSEIGIFIIASRLIAKFGVKWMLIISMLLTTVRWLTLALIPESASAIIFSQTLHAFSFGMTHATSVHFLYTYFASGFQSRAQALYVSIAFGIGGALGSFIAGNIWMQGAGAEKSFIISASFAFVGAFALLLVSSKKFFDKKTA